jgi:hypothetical protein
VIGIGITVLLFVVLGNPSSGGAYQAALLPPFWRALSSALPNGAGVDAVRRVVYFGARGIGGDVGVIAVYVAGGILVTLLGSLRHERRGSEEAGPRGWDVIPATKSDGLIPPAVSRQ